MRRFAFDGEDSEVNKVVLEDADGDELILEAIEQNGRPAVFIPSTPHAVILSYSQLEAALAHLKMQEPS